MNGRVSQSSTSRYVNINCNPPLAVAVSGSGLELSPGEMVGGERDTMTRSVKCHEEGV